MRRFGELRIQYHCRLRRMSRGTGCGRRQFHVTKKERRWTESQLATIYNIRVGDSQRPIFRGPGQHISCPQNLYIVNKRFELFYVHPRAYAAYLSECWTRRYDTALHAACRQHSGLLATLELQRAYIFRRDDMCVSLKLACTRITTRLTRIHQ